MAVAVGRPWNLDDRGDGRGDMLPAPAPATGTGIAIPLRRRHVLQNTVFNFSLMGFSHDIVRRSISINWPDGNLFWHDVITLWRITSLPTNGTLYDGETAITAVPHVVQNLSKGPTQMHYVPDPLFTGTDTFNFEFEDSTGRSNNTICEFIVESTTTMPFGIPDPGAFFHTPIADPSTFVPGVDWWIDSTDPNSVSTGKGTPAAPLDRVPPDNTVFAAGERVFFAAGKYSVPQNRDWTFNGTEANPVIFHGITNSPTRPGIFYDLAQGDTLLKATGTHFICEGLTVENIVWQTFGQNFMYRFCHFLNFNGASRVVDPKDQFNFFHQCQVQTTDEYGTERHGLAFGSEDGSSWVLDTHIHSSGADSIQTGNNEPGPANIFMGRLQMHDDGENSVDIKANNNFAVVECYCWSYRENDYLSNGSDGEAVIANVDHTNGIPIYCLFARNVFFDCDTAAIKHQGGYIISDANVIFRCWQGGFKIGNGGDGTTYTEWITNNTLHYCGAMLRRFAGSQYPANNYFRTYVNNLVGQLWKDPPLNGETIPQPYYHTGPEQHWTGEPNNDFDYNIYAEDGLFNNTASGPFNFATMQSLGWEANGQILPAPWGETDVVVDDELLKPPPGYTAHLNSGKVHNGWAEWLARIGEDTQVDIRGVARPQGAAVDVGAYETG